MREGTQEASTSSTSPVWLSDVDALEAVEVGAYGLVRRRVTEPAWSQQGRTRRTEDVNSAQPGTCVILLKQCKGEITTAQARPTLPCRRRTNANSSMY
jgi:hypothetical protein